MFNSISYRLLINTDEHMRAIVVSSRYMLYTETFNGVDYDFKLVFETNDKLHLKMMLDIIGTGKILYYEFLPGHNYYGELDFVTKSILQNKRHTKNFSTLIQYQVNEL